MLRNRKSARTQGWEPVDNFLVMNNCYIYKHITKNMPDGKEPYVYYGKGTGKRAWKKYGRHEFWKRVYTKYDYDIIILHENLTDEEAFNLEREIIAEAKKNNENLVNIAEGGKGMTSAEATAFEIGRAHV